MATIEARPNGPYLVREAVALVDARGEAITHEAVFALCRCGGSRNKPFCDGSHKANGFSDARLSDGANDRMESYHANGVTIHDNRSICAHAGKCTDGWATVFRYGSEPWIDPTGADAQAIIEAVRACPSGALACTVDGKHHPTPASAPAITVTKDGPYAVEGECELLEARWAQGASKFKYTLCRCGASKNKPFCDGSHWDAGFKDG
jgi:CDGSH-type Zn-finger protein